MTAVTYVALFAYLCAYITFYCSLSSRKDDMVSFTYKAYQYNNVKVVVSEDDVEQTDDIHIQTPKVLNMNIKSDMNMQLIEKKTVTVIPTEKGLLSTILALKSNQVKDRDIKSKTSKMSTLVQPTISPSHPGDLYMNHTIDWRKSRRHFRTAYRVHKTSSIYLIIVNFHYGTYNSINFLKREFFKRFAKYFRYDIDVVYFGTHYNKTAGVLYNRLPNGGWYSYRTVTAALDVFRDINGHPYAGYFLMNDDSYIDPTFLNDYDLSKSLSEPTERYYGSRFWNWKIIRNSRGVLFPTALNRSISLLIEDKQLNERCEFTNQNNIHRGFSDFFYITASDIDLFLNMSNIMISQRVFLEMAVPTMMHCLTNETVVNCNHGKMLNIEKCVHIHPVKYSKPDMRDLALNRLNHSDMKRRPSRLW